MAELGLVMQYPEGYEEKKREQDEQKSKNGKRKSLNGLYTPDCGKQ